jgi:hypothetical protein
MESQWPGAVKKLVNRVSTGESPVTLKQNKNEYYTISAQDCFVVISVLAPVQLLLIFREKGRFTSPCTTQCFATNENNILYIHLVVWCFSILRSTCSIIK